MIKFEINPKNIPDLEPKEDTTLWRYMSFSSLCEILINDYIPLIPIKSFSDKSEGRILKELLSKLPNANNFAIEQIMQVYKEQTYVSSWYNAENENAAMWDRYTPYSGEGVAIKTNAKCLLDSIIDKNEWIHIRAENHNEHTILAVIHNSPPSIIIKPIQYIPNIQNSDIEITPEILQLALQQDTEKMCFFYKMDDYEDESEIRILFSQITNLHILCETGIRYDYKEMLHLSFQNAEQQLNTQISDFQNARRLYIESANKLIEKIIISPYSHNEFIKTVQQTIKNINTARQSKDLPIFQVSKVIESRRKGWV